MADDITPSQYPQLPPDLVSGSWLARNRRLAILGGTVVLLILAIIIVPRIRGNQASSTNTSTSTTGNSSVGVKTSLTNQTLPSNFRRYTITSVPDQDRDGLSDAEEERLGTNPSQADTDGDGLSDYDEVKIYHCDPRKADSDGDGVPDGAEVRRGTNPAGSGNLIDLTHALQQTQTK